MAVYSMTGYASVQLGSTPDSGAPEPKNSPPSQIGLEIRAVNSRFLDLSFKLPDELRQYEPALRELLVGRLKRGKVEVRMALDTGSRHLLPEPSVRLLQRLNNVQDSVMAWLPKAGALSVADVIRLAASEQAPLITLGLADILPLAEQALAALLASRQREGDRLGVMLLERIGQLRLLAAQAVPLVPSWWRNSANALWNAGPRPWPWATAPCYPRRRRTAPCPRPRRLPSGLTWPKRSPA